MRELRQVLVFGALGAGNTFLTTALYQLLLFNGTPYLGSFAFAYVAGIVLAVTVQPLIVFGGPLRANRVLIQSVAYGATGTLGLMLLDLLVQEAQVAAWLSGYLVAGVTVSLNYAVARRLFAPRQHGV